ncbi:hypothetical protein D3C77_563280 [compost metagenome]
MSNASIPNLKPTVAVRHKIQSPTGSIQSTIILEAVEELTGVVVKTSSHKIRQPILPSSIIVRKLDFFDMLETDGYKLKNNEGAV